VKTPSSSRLGFAAAVLLGAGCRRARPQPRVDPASTASTASAPAPSSAAPVSPANPPFVARAPLGRGQAFFLTDSGRLLRLGGKRVTAIRATLDAPHGLAVGPGASVPYVWDEQGLFEIDGDAARLVLSWTDKVRKTLSDDCTCTVGEQVHVRLVCKEWFWSADAARRLVGFEGQERRQPFVVADSAGKWWAVNASNELQHTSMIGDLIDVAVPVRGSMRALAGALADKGVYVLTSEELYAVSDGSPPQRIASVTSDLDSAAMWVGWNGTIVVRSGAHTVTFLTRDGGSATGTADLGRTFVDGRGRAWSVVDGKVTMLHVEQGAIRTEVLANPALDAEPIRDVVVTGAGPDRPNAPR
jgi:hypothetical protein